MNDQPSVRPLDSSTWGCVHAAGRGEQRGVGRLLVHGLPRQAEGPDRAAGLADHLLLHRQGLRKRGVAQVALGGALAEIARLGGTVEGYPEETDDRTVAGSFLHTGPMAAFEHHGFTRTRPISPHRWVVTREVSRS